MLDCNLQSLELLYIKKYRIDLRRDFDSRLKKMLIIPVPFERDIVYALQFALKTFLMIVMISYPFPEGLPLIKNRSFRNFSSLPSNQCYYLCDNDILTVFNKLKSMEFFMLLSSFHTDNDNMLKLNLKDMALEFSWPIGRIKDTLPGFDAPSPSTPKCCSIESLRSIASLLSELNIPEAKIALASGVSAFLWLYIAIQG